MLSLAFGFFSKFFGRRQKLDSTVDMTSGVIFGCDLKSSLWKYNFHYILCLLNASTHFSLVISLSLFAIGIDNNDLLLARRLANDGLFLNSTLFLM